MVLKIKTISSFGRGDHIESKYINRNEFYPFQNTMKATVGRHAIIREKTSMAFC